MLKFDRFAISTGRTRIDIITMFSTGEREWERSCSIKASFSGHMYYHHAIYVHPAHGRPAVVWDAFAKFLLLVCIFGFVLCYKLRQGKPFCGLVDTEVEEAGE